MNSPSPPYSQCDAKGRCIRHPTIQMSRKKKLGGWKKLTAICPMCAMELMSMSNAIINKNNNGNDRVDGVSIPSNDVYCNVVGGNSSPPPPSTSSSPPLSRSRTRMEPPSDSVSLHSNSSSPQAKLRRQRRAPQVGHHDQQNDLGHHDQQDDRSVDNRSVYSAPSAPSTYNNSDNQKHQHQQQHYKQQQQQQRSPPPQQQRRRVSIASKQTSNPSASDSSCESTVDMSYESEFSSSATNLNSNNYNSRPGLRRVDSTGSASVFSQSSRGSVRSSTSTHRSPETSAGRRRTNLQQQPPPQQHPHRGHHSPIDAPPIDGNNAVRRQNQEQFVCGMELFVDDSRCFYTGQIHMETQLPHGLGTLRSELGHGMSEGQWHFGRLVQESNGGGGGRVAPPPPPPQDNLGVPNLGSPSIYPRDVISSQDCQEDDGMHRPSGYPVEEEEYYQEDDYQEEYHHHQEEEVEEEHVNYCLPCTSANEEETLCNDLREQCQVEESDAGSETDSQESSYTARESKSHIPPSSSSSEASSSPSGRHSSSRNISHHKLQEYKRYIVKCEEEENYYHDEEGRAVYSQEFGGNDYERPMRRVRFQEDP